MLNSEPRGKDKSARQHRFITNDEKVKWALERFGPLRYGKRPKRVETIAKEHGRQAVIVTRAIFQAFKEGLVEIKESPRPIAAAERVESVELELEKLCGLHAVVVSPGDLSALEPFLQSDMAHRCLGAAFARILSSSAGFFRTKDVIGFGSGRSVFYLVEALRRLPPLRIGGITLASVTGALHARDYAGELAALCDGDFHASLGSMSFVGQPPPKLRLMHAHLACSSETIKKRGSRAGQGELDLLSEQREKEFKQTWLGGREWTEAPVSHLICGTGVLAIGHRLHLSAARSNTAERLREEAGLESVSENLRELSRLADEVTRKHPDYYPVGDICNFLFYIENPEISERTSEIRGLIDAVNRCLLNVQEEQLFSIGSIILIAGTAKKRRAIAQLLTSDPFRRGGTEKRKLKIEYLCIDQETGEWVRDWFARPRAERDAAS